jgi:hypothetical protein
MPRAPRTRVDERLRQLRALCPDDGEVMTATGEMIDTSDDPDAPSWVAGFVCPLHPDEVIRLWRPEFHRVIAAVQGASPRTLNLVRVAYVRHESVPARRVVLKVRLSGHADVQVVIDDQGGERFETVGSGVLPADEWLALRTRAETPALLELPLRLGHGQPIEQVIVYLGDSRFETGATADADLPAPLAAVLDVLRPLVARALRGELRTNPLRRSASGEIGGDG